MDLSERSNLIWDYLSPHQYMKRFGRGLQTLPPLVITVAITGAVQGKEANPNLPETAEEQAQSTYEAWNAGASLVHVHARRPDALHMMSHDTDRYYEVNTLIRERCPDIIIEDTMAGDLIDNPSGQEIFEWGSLYANPEMSSLDAGPQAFKVKLKRRESPLTGRDSDVVVDTAFTTTYGETEALAKEMRRLGIKPEFEVFNSGQYTLVDNLVDQQLVEPPHWVQFVLGGHNANYPTPIDVMHMIQNMPSESMFSVIGIGAYQLPLHVLSIILGGHVRVGMEDNVYYRRGELATSNAQFVERIVRIANELGREVATPAQARQMLGLPATPTEYPRKELQPADAGAHPR
jgi:3-keto-5-aminohexanoate cleavage enzyme